MSAEKLREAAKALREVAEAATPGDKWQVGHPRRCSSAKAVEIEYLSHVYAQAYTGTEANARYIATMAPPVALALADLLDWLAKANENGVIVGASPALAVADAILGAGA